jgi:tetratricopeptide (TPR) repeat protein
MFKRIRVFGFAVVCACIAATWPAIGPAQEVGTTDAVDTYFRAIDAFDQGRIDQALGVMTGVVRAFEKTGFEKGQFMARLFTARMYRRQGRYDRAMAELRKAGQMKTRSKDLLGEGLVMLRTADLEMDRSSFADAQKSLDMAMANVTALEDRSLVAAIGLRQARILTLRGRYGDARQTLERSLDLFRKAGDGAGETSALVQLAQLDRLQGKYDSSLKTLDKARTMALQAGLEQEQRLVAFTRAFTLAAMGETGKARAILEKSVKAFTAVGDKRNAARARTCLALAEMRSADPAVLLRDLQGAAKDLERLKAGCELAQTLLVEGRLLTLNGKFSDASKVLERARVIFNEIDAPLGELLTRLALALVRSRQGAFISAWQNVERAKELARSLGTPRELADTARIGGMTALEQRNFTEAVSRYDKALKLYRSIKNLTGAARCYAGRCHALTGLGFLARAEADLEALQKIVRPSNDLLIRGDILFLKGKIALARGNEPEARTQFERASAVYVKFARPVRRAVLLEAGAQREFALRNIAKAESLWKRAEKSYAAMPSPGGVLDCRAARVDLALDREDFFTAEALARQGIPTSLGIGKARARPVRLALLSGTRYASDADRDGFFQETSPWPDKMDGGTVDRVAGKDPDSQLFNAELHALRARVALASGKTAVAEKLINQAVNGATALGQDRLMKRFARILGRIQREKGEYEDALKTLEKTGPVVPWEAARVRAPALAGKGKTKEAMAVFAGALKNLLSAEAEEGLWLVSPAECRRREGLYEDYIDLLLNAARGPDGNAAALRAWNVAQMLKMRRVFYDRAAVGASGFPGVPDELEKELKRLQYEGINAAKRAANPISTGSRQGNGRVEDLKEPSPQAVSGKLEALFNQMSSNNRDYGALARARPPTLARLRALLSPKEVYVCFLSGRKGIFGFLVTKKTLKGVVLTRTPAEIRKETLTLMREVTASRSTRISGASCDLWKKLFEPFRHPIPDGNRLIIEPDGFLTLFPFEALVPEECPQSSKKRRLMQPLSRRIDLVRTTSATRFVRSRDSKDKKRPASLAVFAAPILPEPGHADTANLPSVRIRRLARAINSDRVETAKLGARISRLFGDKGTLYYGARVNVPTFLREGMSVDSLVHMMCPLLLPGIPAGRQSQPFLLFSGNRHDPWADLCGVNRLTGEPRRIPLLTLTSLAGDGDGSRRALVLFLESLGFMGVRSVALPLRPAARRNAGETESLMIGFYSALKDGATPTDALKRAQRTLDESREKKGGFKPARFVIF